MTKNELDHLIAEATTAILEAQKLSVSKAPDRVKIFLIHSEHLKIYNSTDKNTMSKQYSATIETLLTIAHIIGGGAMYNKGREVNSVRAGDIIDPTVKFLVLQHLGHYQFTDSEKAKIITDMRKINKDPGIQSSIESMLKNPENGSVTKLVKAIEKIDSKLANDRILMSGPSSPALQTADDLSDDISQHIAQRSGHTQRKNEIDKFLNTLKDIVGEPKKGEPDSYNTIRAHIIAGQYTQLKNLAEKKQSSFLSTRSDESKLLYQAIRDFDPSNPGKKNQALDALNDKHQQQHAGPSRPRM
jgi:hypothetical protein